MISGSGTTPERYTDLEKRTGRAGVLSSLDAAGRRALTPAGKKKIRVDF